MKAKITTRLLASIDTRPKAYEVCDTELAGFILRVQPTGVMTYVCSYRLKDGRRHRNILGKTTLFTPVQARDWAFEVLAKVRRGEDPTPTRKAPSDMLIVFLETKYGPWVKAHRKRGDLTLFRLKSYFRDFHKCPLSEISAWMIEKWRSQKLRDGLKPVSVNREISALRSALTKAIEWGHLDVHPLLTVKPLKVDRRGIVRYLSEDEESRLRWALAEREEQIRRDRVSGNRWRSNRGLPLYPDLRFQRFVDHLQPLVLFSINTGLRRGELLSLRWSNVDFSKSNISVVGSTSKNGRTRHLPMNKEALSILRAWREQNPGLDDELVFRNTTGEKIQGAKRAWANVLKLAEIANFRWHDLRHHFASKLVMTGSDLNTVRELLGHSEITMTIRYAHLAPHVTAAAVERLEWTRQPIESAQAESRVSAQNK